MKITLSAIVFTLLGSSTALQAEEGKALYAKNCTACHGTEVFTRPNRRTKNLTELKARVKQCIFAVESNWFDEDINAVANYLNTSFYKF